MIEEYGHIPDGFFLKPEEVEELRKSKRELTDYGKQKLKEMMTKPLQAKISTEDYNKVLNALNLEELDEREKVERCERSNRVLERYNHYYNLECASLSHGMPITPEHQQIIAFESMIDALRCEHLNQEYNAIAITDIKDLIEGLRNQSNEFLKTVKEFKDSADGVA